MPSVRADALPLVLPSATTRIEPFENWLFRQAVGATPSYDDVHEGFGYVACARGSAVSLSELLSMVGCHPDDGPMLMSSSIELPSPLRVGIDYTVTARILSLEGARGRTLGRYDVMAHEWCLVDGDGSTVYRYVGRLAIPRADPA